MTRAAKRDSRSGRILIGRVGPLSTAFWRSVDIVREEGLTVLWFKLLGETVYRRMRLFERYLDEPIGTTGVQPEIELGTLRDDETDACLELRPEGSRDELRHRLSRGGFCFVARVADRVVALTWASRGVAWIEYLRTAIELGPDDAYLYEVVVHPEVRGQRIAAALFAHAYRELRHLGVRRAIFAVNLENTAGLRSLSGNGARELGLKGFVALGSWRHDFYRPIGVKR